MSNPYLGVVNQQVIFARHQLNLKIDETNANDRMRNRGVLEAGLWHLCRAYRAYITEIGANYKLTKPEVAKDAKELSEALEAINKHPAEASELFRLEGEGFIREMLVTLCSIELIEGGKVAPPPSESARDADPLKMVDLSDSPEKIDFGFDDLAGWIQQFKELVDRHREHMIEY